LKKKADSYTVIIRVLLVLIAATAAAIGVNALLYAYGRYELKTHPIEYRDLVEHYSWEYKLDKYLVYAVIKTESGFDKNAESNMKARGLMQITEVTFDWIKFRLGGGGEFGDMYDAEQNIRYGCFQLSYNLEEYGGDVNCALAAYHAGRGSVDGWLENREYSKDGKKLDRIPASDTAHYVGKVNKAYQTYKKLYEGEK